jgi:amino acid transporter
VRCDIDPPWRRSVYLSLGGSPTRKLAPGSVTLWLLATVPFMVPLAIAAAALSVKYPGTGGFYLWTRNDFGPWPGFLWVIVYWNSATREDLSS